MSRPKVARKVPMPQLPPLRVKPEVMEELRTIARAECKTVSEVARSVVNDGLAVRRRGSDGAQ